MPQSLPIASPVSFETKIIELEKRLQALEINKEEDILTLLRVLDTKTTERRGSA
ncbi:hypothetical protein [Salibacterium halotolerans]|uniref:Uncharacterized protein n=1 Tax=Salibacterium halotolerans TaxID=1884432 RepID=A0A1I5NKQ9_9BACI|nr:hypothetical protein [Salibacterium halotolerans]SFP22379.1 hypothetical protein SAMN05518683_103191 [Salibacterium halotolerans]